MEEIRIKGLRSLVDTGYVDIKPINILVGINSSGKSTFLRTFPLFRQSIERKTRGPILWTGMYTDFESFSTSLHNGNRDDSDENLIEFIFKFKFDNDNFYIRTKDKKETFSVEASLSLAEVPSKNSCFTKKYSIKNGDHKLTFSFDDDGSLTGIHSNRFTWRPKKTELKLQRAETDSLLPVFSRRGYSYFYDADDTKITSVLFSNIKDLIRLYSGSRSSKKVSWIARMLVGSLDNDLDRLSLMRNISSTKKWMERVSSWDLKNPEFLELCGLLDLFSVIENSALINRQLSLCFRNIRYIAPLRASTERYYRYQDLSTDQLDHRGENIAMFLSNMPKRWRLKFDKWITDNFGYTIKQKVSTGHISIELEHESAKVSDNLADMGFGYSQVLPIVVQLWSVASGYEASMQGPLYREQPIIFAIEQPELHLHPMMQAKLASIFSESIELAKQNEIDLRLIVETHSQSIISKIGDLIATDNQSKENVNVLLFDKEVNTRSTKVSYSHFDSEGRLLNWPMAFFAY